MSAYLYAIIPYKSGVPSIGCRIPELEGLESELYDIDGYDCFEDFFLINTCHRMFSIMTDRDGFSWLRREIYKIATAVGAKEVWYCEELATDQMYDDECNPAYSIKELNTYIANNSYCFLEYDIDTMREKSGKYASYMHDDFHDIVLARK